MPTVTHDCGFRAMRTVVSQLAQHLTTFVDAGGPMDARQAPRAPDVRMISDTDPKSRRARNSQLESRPHLAGWPCADRACVASGVNMRLIASRCSLHRCGFVSHYTRRCRTEPRMSYVRASSQRSFGCGDQDSTAMCLCWTVRKDERHALHAVAMSGSLGHAQMRSSPSRVGGARHQSWVHDDRCQGHSLHLSSRRAVATSATATIFLGKYSRRLDRSQFT